MRDIAEIVQEDITEWRSEVWPVCAMHGTGVHAEVRTGRAVWWCRSGEHAVSEIGMLGATQDPARTVTPLPICTRHHHLVHDGGWTLHLTPDRTLTIRRPDAETHTTSRPHMLDQHGHDHERRRAAA